MSAIFKIAKRELRYIATTKSRIGLLFVIPLVVFILLNVIYVKELVRDIPLAVLDEDHTELTRAITRSIDSTPTVKVLYRVSSIEEVKNLIFEGKVQGAFYYPKGMTSKIKKGGSGKVGVYINSTNIIYSNLLLKESSKVIITIASAVLLKEFESQMMTPEKAMTLVQPIKVHARSMFNPNYSYLQYLTPGLMTVLFQMIIMFAATGAINREFHNGTTDKMFETAGGKVFPVFGGKLLAYVAASLFTIVLIIGVIFPMFDIKLYGNVFYLFAFFVWFSFVSAALGLMLSSIFVDPVLALDIAFFYNSPAFVFSGFTFPVWAMPAFHQFYAAIIPYTYFLTGFLQIYQMNVPITDVLPSIISLGIFFAVGSAVTLVALKLRIKNSTEKKAALSAGTVND